MMNIEPKNLIYFVSPLILVGVAWGVSTATINDLQAETEVLRKKVEKVQVMEVEVKYIKEQVNKNSDKLDTILEKMK
tara:strand:+ start:1240 stop:1470 length:231 start_codon:yes stop_codon:yes gene_type:complete